MIPGRGWRPGDGSPGREETAGGCEFSANISGNSGARSDHPGATFIGLLRHSASGSPKTLRASVMIGSSLAQAGRAVGALGEPRLDRVPNLRRDLDAVEPRDLLNAGRRGDVDLGQPIADHVDPDKDQALIAQGRPDRRADLAVAPGQLGPSSGGRRHAYWPAPRLPRGRAGPHPSARLRRE